jgi:hypothetical protein
MTAQQLARWLGWLDVALVVIVLALAFLLASFSVRNSDFWMQLATGRLIAQGKYQFGKDPFAWTTENVYWINHSWLFGLLVYGVFQTLGGTALVVIKALAVTLLAAILLAIRRPGQSLWFPAVGTALALLAVSPRLFLQPTIASFVLLGLMLFLVLRPGLRPQQKGATRWFWLLPVLFVFWVNLDSWFLIGPVVVGLFLLGEWAQATLAPTSAGDLNADQRRSLGLVFLLGLVACLVNPHFVAAFRLPQELDPGLSDSVVRQMPLSIRYALISPFHSDYVNLGGKSVAGMAYYPLAILGFLSFGLNLRQLRWGRALLWLAFLALSAYSARAIPFFAIIAGPVTVLNFQDFAARVYGTEPRVENRWKELLVSGRVVALLAGIVLLVLTWPGALQAFADQAYQARRVGWRVEPDPAYEQAAIQLHKWHETGELSDRDRAFILQPEMANYCAWYCPEEKGFFDLRLQLFGPVADKYLTLTRGLVPTLEQVEGTTKDSSGAEKSAFDIDVPGSALDLLRELNISHVVLTTGSPRTLMLGLFRMWAKPEQWPMLYLNGRTVVVGWNDPKAGAADHFANLRLDLDRLAFGPDALQAPGEGPPHEPEARNLWTRYAIPPKARPLGCDEVTLYVGYFQAVGNQKQRTAQLAAQAGVYAGHVAALIDNPSPGLSHWISFQGQPYTMGAFLERPNGSPTARPLLADLGPPAVEYLAIRAARRAVAESPDDAATYVSLKDALQLRNMTRERYWPVVLPLLGEMRDLELTAAWQRALKLQPSDWTLHEQLARFLMRRGYLDTSLSHLKQALDGERNAAAGRGRNTDWEKQMQKEIESLQKEVQQRGDTFLKEKVNRPLLGRVELAKQLHLHDRALEEMRELDQSTAPTDPAQKSQLVQQFAERVQLLFDVGLLDDGNQYLEVLRENPMFLKHRLVAAAAEGRYDEVDQLLANQSAELTKLTPPAARALYRSLYNREASGPVSLQEVISAAVARAILDQPLEGRPYGGLIVHFLQRHEQFSNMDFAGDYLRLVGESLALQAIMALERGNNTEAQKLFRQAEPLLSPRIHPQTGGPDPGALRVVQDALEMMKGADNR